MAAHPQLIQTLLDLGFDINAKDEDGLTALDYALGRGYVPFLQMPQPPNQELAARLRKLGATVELGVDAGVAGAGHTRWHRRLRLGALAARIHRHALTGLS